MKNEIKEIAGKNKVKIIIKDFFNYVCVDQPKSLEETARNADFWKDILEKFNKGVEKIRFVYQEKDKEIPLSYGKSLFKKIDFNIQPQTEPGGIKYEEANPKLIISQKNSVVLITKEDEWKRFNEISKNSDSFSAPFVLLPKNLCYKINIPLECIIETRFKSNYLKYKL